MLRTRIFALAAALLAATCVTTGAAAPQTTTASPKSPNKEAIGQQQVRQLLLLMDTNKNGKISKQEWMDYMSAEFDRLDTDHSGELDPRELASSSLRASHPPLPDSK
jgi:Ca2+-binding EF-hand superfamily protein